MKKLIVMFLFVVIAIISIFGIVNFSESENIKTEYLRIHIRANSNSEIDQNVKYKVKDAVVEFLTPFIAECDTEIKAEKLIEKHLKEAGHRASPFPCHKTYLCNESTGERNGRQDLS